MDLDIPKNTAAALEIRNLGKSFGAVDVLKSIDVSMDAGEFLVLVGPSGCGKSTLLNCIAGLEETTSGTLSIGGRDVTQEPPRDRNIAMVFQSYALYPTMNVAENIGFGMKIRKISKEKIDKKAAEVANLLQIDALLDRRPSQLSGGQRQRVAMGRALVRDPVLFLFDEPLSNLDAKLRVEMRAEIKHLHHTTGTSIVYVTHDQIEAMTLATKIVVLKDGIVQQIGTPEDIYDHPANTFVADFMGTPPMNLVPGKIDAKGCVDLGGGQIVPWGDAPDALKTGETLIVGMRPEDIRISTDPTGLQLVPTMIENAGSDAYVSFDLSGEKVTARFSGRFHGKVGEHVGLAFDPQKFSFFRATDGARINTQ